MSPLIIDIPEGQADLARWLEDLLVEGKMPQLAAELRAVHGPPAQADFEWQNDLPLDAVYGQGFTALSEAMLRSLLVHPAVLLELSGKVFEEGGRF
jgi:hypothetical protein